MVELLDPHELRDMHDGLADALCKLSADRIPGGLADEKKPTDFNQAQLHKGVKSELEHTSSKPIAKEIAMDHLVEDPRYYLKLEKMEKGADLKPKLSACVDELINLGVITDHQAEDGMKLAEQPEEQIVDTVRRMRRMEREKPTGEELGRSAAVGAALGPAMSGSRRAIMGENLVGLKPEDIPLSLKKRGVTNIFSKGLETADVAKIRRFRAVRGLRDVAASMGVGAIIGGAMPQARMLVERMAKKRKLEELISQHPDPEAIALAKRELAV